MLRDVSNVNMKTTIMGNEIDFPIGIAPTGLQKMAHPEGEVATAKGTMMLHGVFYSTGYMEVYSLYTIHTAAVTMKTCLVLSCWITSSIEEVSQANGSGLRWFQLYVFKDKSMTMDLVQRAEMAGYKALVITVDAPVTGKRLANLRNGYELPNHLKIANFGTHSVSMEPQQQYKYTQSLIDPKLTWDTITWVKSFTKLPVIVKGVLTGEDAKLAVHHGVDGIIVSNHGGRQLDGVLATVSCV